MKVQKNVLHLHMQQHISVINFKKKKNLIQPAENHVHRYNQWKCLVALDTFLSVWVH